MTIFYKAWIDSFIVGEWSDREQAHQAILEFIEHSPDDSKVVHFGAFKRTVATGTKPLYSFMGADQIREHINEVDSS